VPSRSAIYRALVSHQLIEPVARRRRRADYRRWERDRPMELWQLDVMGRVWLVDGRELKVVSGLDDHSRFCVMAGLVERANARSVCQVFAAVLERYGIPDEILTDNGKVFTGRLGPHPAEAQQVIDRWVEGYNTVRPHQALGMATPAERFGAKGSRPPAPTAPSSPSQRPTRPHQASAISTEVTQIVGSNGCIRVAYQRLSIGRHLTGETVVARVEPTLLQIFHHSQLVRTVARDNALEVRHLRAKEVNQKRRDRRPRSAPTTHVS
jgi:hypothetical protein